MAFSKSGVVQGLEDSHIYVPSPVGVIVAPEDEFTSERWVPL